MLKIARRPTDNDLLRREACVLPRLRDARSRRFAAYLPELLDSFTHREKRSRADRLVNVLDCPQGIVSVAAIRTAFPDGLDPRDAAWMWRRLLVALGVAQRWSASGGVTAGWPSGRPSSTPTSIMTTPTTG